MLKFLGYFVVTVAVLGFGFAYYHNHKVSKMNEIEMSRYDTSEKYKNHLKGKTLVIYYSLSKHTQKIAEKIQELTGADIYEIETEEPIKHNLMAYWKIRQQLKKKNYPKLKEKAPDLSKYTTIIIGGPVWWYTVATPMISFLNEADFKGKKVAVFSTQSSNYGRYFEDFKSFAKHADIKTTISFNNTPEKYSQAEENKLINWLNKI